MLNKLFLTGTALAFLAATVAIVPVGTAQAGMMGDTMKCRQMAKDKYPNDAKMRKMMRAECKAQMKMMKQQGKM